VVRKKKSAILEAVHETAKGLYKAGGIDQKTLGEFDQLCRSQGELGVSDRDR
jgi:putative transcriptional regulator